MTKKNQDPIKIGIIGLGRAGWDIHIKRLREDGRFKITAVNDLEESRLDEAREEFGCDVFTDYEQLLKKADCELVVVASQSIDHGKHTIAALKSGRHVIVEKPMALSTSEATSMIEAAEAAGRKLFVHQNQRYSPIFRHIMEVIASGLLGEVFAVRMRELRFVRRNDWQTLKKFGGGHLNNNGPHFIDQALICLGSPIKHIFTDVQLTTDVGDADDYAKIIFKGENGRVVDLEMTTSCAFPEPVWTLLGTAGTLRSDGVTSEIKYFDPAKAPALLVNEAPPANREYGNGEELPWKTETRDSAADVPTDFYDNVHAVIREDKPMDILPEQVREIIRVLEIAHRENPSTGAIAASKN